MPTHKVKQGEHISSIAEHYGFSDYRVIWDDGQNAKLKQLRKNPHTLLPGDELFIPEKQSGLKSVSTEQHYRFKLSGSTLKLNLVIKDFDGKPFEDTACRLHIGNQVHDLQTDDNGMVQAPISHDAHEALLQFEDPSLPFDVNIAVKIGHLDPIDTITGQKARLRNMGYYHGPVDNEPSSAYQYSVEEFQCDFDLTVDGVCGEQTQNKLKQEHGC